MEEQAERFEDQGDSNPLRSIDDIRPEIATILKQSRTSIMEQWTDKMRSQDLMEARSEIVTVADFQLMYDALLTGVETNKYERIQERAAGLVAHIIKEERSPEASITAALQLRDLIVKPLAERLSPEKLRAAIDMSLSVMDKIIASIAVNLLDIVYQQEEAIRELSTPILQVKPKLLLLPIVGSLDSWRARQLTDEILTTIRAKSAKVVVLDITGMPTVDSAIANHIVQTVQAARLLGATIIVTGLSSQNAQTLVRLGVDLGRIKTMGDLQSGLEEADRLMAHRTSRLHRAA